MQNNMSPLATASSTSVERSKVPNTSGLPYSVAYITASANSVTSNPVAVYVHSQVSSISLVGPQQCLSQTQLAQLDAQACYSSNGTQYLMCAPSTVTSDSRRAGRIPRRNHAQASSPTEGMAVL